MRLSRVRRVVLAQEVEQFSGSESASDSSRRWRGRFGDWQLNRTAREPTYAAAATHPCDPTLCDEHGDSRPANGSRELPTARPPRSRSRSRRLARQVGASDSGQRAARGLITSGPAHGLEAREMAGRGAAGPSRPGRLAAESFRRLADFDLFVIGAGSGGVACARRAASHGARVAICEHSRVGGTCVIRGCIPKKLMRYGAHFAEHFSPSKGYGWRPGTPPLDWPALIAARDREIDRLNGIYISMLKSAGAELISGARPPGRTRTRSRSSGEVHSRPAHRDRGRRPPEPARAARHRARDHLRRRARAPGQQARASRGDRRRLHRARARQHPARPRRRDHADPPARSAAARLRSRRPRGARRAAPRARPRAAPGDHGQRASSAAATACCSRPRPARSSSTPCSTPPAAIRCRTPRPRPRASWASPWTPSGAVRVDRSYRSSVPEHLCARRLQRPCRQRARSRQLRSDPGRDRRGPRDRRGAVQRQPAAGPLRHDPDRGVQPARGGRGRAERGAARAPRATTS